MSCLLRSTCLALLLALPAAAAMAQSNPIGGQGAGVIHGQNWGQGQQDLNGPSGSSLSRTEQLRRRSAQERPQAQRNRAAANRQNRPTQSR